MQAELRLQALPFSSAKTYLAAIVFITGNIIMPQLFHLVPQGGVTWLHIYFFTLIGAYIYGWRTGLLTAVASPVANALLFGMPAIAGLPAILLKSVLLAIIAGYAAKRFNKASILILLGVVAGYQVFGTVGEWIIKGDFFLACQDFRIGIPGILLQIIGGRLVLRALTGK